MAKYYAVARGRNPGVYDNWNDCKEQVDRFPNARHKRFNSLEEALDFIEENRERDPIQVPVNIVVVNPPVIRGWLCNIL